MSKMRLDKLLSNCGYAGRRQLKKIAKTNSITVNGLPVRDLSLSVDPEADEIFFDGERVHYREFVYLMMNKPKGVICATEDKYHETVLDLVDEHYRRTYKLFPVGRLDYNTEGLLLLTNDGAFSHNLTSPKKSVDKVYFVQVDGDISFEVIERFREGVHLMPEDYITLPASVEMLSFNNPNSCYLTIREGKFHQVKRMFQSVGLEVLALKRVQIGNLPLDEGLFQGEYRELTPEELENLKSFIKKDVG